MVTFYTFLQHEKSKGFLNVHEKNSSGLAIIRISQENQLKDKYVTNKMEKVLWKEGHCDNFIK